MSDSPNAASSKASAAPAAPLPRPSPTAPTYALLSVATALVTIALKLGAYFLTGSVGLFSDAAESFVNLVAAVVAFFALRFASQPADDEHAFGHTKAEYFSSGLEGLLILLAAAAIAVSAVPRLLHPRPLERVFLGLLISTLAAAVNGLVAFILLRAGRRLHSVTLKADAHHLLTDVWTSGGVLLGVLLVEWTGVLVLDPIVALLVAANIVWTGLRLMSESGHGLLDRALPADEQALIAKVLAPYQERGIAIHALRTRMAGPRRFIEMHVLVPGAWTVQKGHELCDEIERALIGELPRSSIITHIEPLEDPRSWDDRLLERK